MTVESLRANLQGTVTAKGEPQYEALRRELVWNRLVPEAHPELIVRVRSEADVVEAIGEARAQGLGVAVRGGGHNWCGTPLRDGTLLIDLSGLDGLTIDMEGRSATVQPGVSGRAFSRALAAQGLAFPIGHCGSVPMSGYLLSGGLGWNMGVWGPACANLRAVELVMADGARVTATETSHADLVWAARGAGACFFAVATRFHLDVHPLPAGIHTSTYVYPLACTDAVAQWAAQLVPTLERCVELTIFLFAPPGATECFCVLTAAAFAESPAAAERALQPLAGCPVADRCLQAAALLPTPFDTLVDNVDAMFPDRHRYLADALWLNASAAEVLPLMRERIVQAPSAKSAILCGLVSPPAGLPDMAFSLSARTFLACYAIWDDPHTDAANRAWHRDTVALVEGRAAGRYIGECDIAGARTRAERSFSEASWRRLGELRRRYDPEARFGTTLFS